MEILLQGELLRENCLAELLQARKDEEHRFAEKSSNSSGKSWRMQMHQAVNILLPRVHRILIDCRYLKLVFNLPWSSTRRKLAQTPGEEPSPSPPIPVLNSNPPGEQTVTNKCHKRSVVVAVVVTASVRLVIVALLFTFCGIGKKDGRHLLSLSTSDYSKKDGTHVLHCSFVFNLCSLFTQVIRSRKFSG